MKKFILPIGLSFISLITYALNDTCIIPIQRSRFHDRINEEQKKCDKADGKLDGLVRVGANDEINLQITDVINRRVDVLECYVENHYKIIGNNEKIRNLNYIEDVVRGFRVGWRNKTLNPTLAPTLIDEFEKALIANIDSQSIAPFIEESTYEIANIIAPIFNKNIGYADCRRILFLKNAAINPGEILSYIRPYVDEPFADSLIIIACQKDPIQLYSFAQAINTPEGKLIHRSVNPMVMTVAKLSQTPNALSYFPFLDDILSGKQTLEGIKKIVGDSSSHKCDSVAYYKLLVKTEIDYYSRLVKKDTPIAMFGVNGLHFTLKDRAIKNFITPINELHEQNNLAVRMKAISPLTPQEIYYMMVMGENDIYTSSYKHSFERLLQKLGNKTKTDELLMSVNMDYFKKFIKMAANFNQLDTFLKLMPTVSSEVLMKAFVAKLDDADNLEDAVDVADSYSSINNNKLLKNILDNVTENQALSIANNNNKGRIIYGLLKSIFLSNNDPKIDLTTEIGIPPIYSVDPKLITNDSGVVVQQVFFYGDDDGKKNYDGFMKSFSAKEWRIEKKPEWVIIKSIKGKPVWIFANRPLDSDSNLDDSAQIHLNKYLESIDITPTVVIHRGHSYWLPGTIARMPGDAKIIVLGSCGGYKNLNQILSLCPEAHIISTKEIGKGDINRPILNYLNQTFTSGKVLEWKSMWTILSKTFSKESAAVKESWDDYVPPYKNLGAIFIKAYNKKMESE